MPDRYARCVSLSSSMLAQLSLLLDRARAEEEVRRVLFNQESVSVDEVGLTEADYQELHKLTQHKLHGREFVGAIYAEPKQRELIWNRYRVLHRRNRLLKDPGRITFSRLVELLLDAGLKQISETLPENGTAKSGGRTRRNARKAA